MSTIFIIKPIQSKVFFRVCSRFVHFTWNFHGKRNIRFANYGWKIVMDKRIDSLSWWLRSWKNQRRSKRSTWSEFKLLCRYGITKFNKSLQKAVSNESDWRPCMKKLKRAVRARNDRTHWQEKETHRNLINIFLSRFHVYWIFFHSSLFLSLIRLLVQSTVSRQVIQCHTHSISIDLSNKSGICEILTTVCLLFWVKA